MSWQPIETAPKDDRWLILFNKYDGVRVGYRHRVERCYGDEQYLYPNVTHWMPLPAPPEAE